MKTPAEEPTGPRGPRTTAPDSDDRPLKQKAQPAQDEDTSGSDVEERHQTEPPPPHGDPLRRTVPR